MWKTIVDETFSGTVVKDGDEKVFWPDDSDKSIEQKQETVETALETVADQKAGKKVRLHIIAEVEE